MGRKLQRRRDPYGAWLHHLRKEHRLTQQQFADVLGVPRTTLAYWEQTGNLTGRKVILKMAAVLGISVAALLRDEKSAKSR